jgi:polysaccharide deacetylase 2 family uncharacterized protein YibQ
VDYEERRELYVEMSTREQRVVARMTFVPRSREQLLAGQVRGRIALIVDDFGYIRNRLTAGFMALKDKLTFSIIPGHRYSRMLAQESVQSGHEVIVHMPMEPTRYNGQDEVAYILRPEMERAEIVRRIRRAFQEVPQAVGMNNHEGSLATQDTVLMEIVAWQLRERGKYFIDSYTTPDTRALAMMRKHGVPSRGRNFFLDNEDDPIYIRQQLGRLAERAERTGSAIGIAHVGSSHLNTLDVLQEEIPRLKELGFQFVFVSELVEEASED